MKRLIMVGIDGMDYKVIEDNLGILPNIRSMIRNDRSSCIRSVFPPDTTPAWSTIFTGLDPSQHGIINFVNVGDKTNQYKPTVVNDSFFMGKTLWDRLNRAGKKAVVLLPINIYPGWEINGLMITRGSKGIEIWPKEKYELYNPDKDLLSLDGKFISSGQMGRFLSELNRKMDEEMRLTRLALENEDFDFMFTYFSTLDAVQHAFWNLCDKDHPEYPGDNQYSNAILDMYVKMDTYIGKILKTAGSSTVIVLSDHGHGARPVYTARINQMLKNAGLLVPAKAEKKHKKPGIKSKLKHYAINYVGKFGIPSPLLKLAREFPVWKKLFASSTDLNFQHTKAYLSDLSAIKNYSFGGIRINGDDKSKIADQVISALKDIKIPGEENKAFVWIGRREELYSGENIDKFPEVLFHLDERYGAEWELGDKVFEKKGFMYKLSPGSHKWLTGVFMYRGLEVDYKPVELVNICDIVCDYLN